MIKKIAEYKNSSLLASLVGCVLLFASAKGMDTRVLKLLWLYSPILFFIGFGFGFYYISKVKMEISPILGTIFNLIMFSFLVTFMFGFRT